MGRGRREESEEARGADGAEQLLADAREVHAAALDQEQGQKDEGPRRRLEQLAAAAEEGGGRGQGRGGRRRVAPNRSGAADRGPPRRWPGPVGRIASGERGGDEVVGHVGMGFVRNKPTTQKQRRTPFPSAAPFPLRTFQIPPPPPNPRREPMASSRLLPSRRLFSALLHTPSPIPTPRATGGGGAATPFAPFLQPRGIPARFFSATRRGGAPRQRAVDIGARARQLQSRRLWTYALTFGCAAGFVVTVLATFQDQLVFYLTPTDALARFTADPSKSRVRLGGLVLEGSVAHPSASSAEIEFVVTDLVTDVLVRYEGALPDLFREGHSVVVEGFLKPFTDDLRRDGGGRKVSDKAREGECFFRATEVLAKHDEKYMPKEVGEAIERNKKKIEAEAATAAEQTAAVAADGAKLSS